MKKGTSKQSKRTSTAREIKISVTIKLGEPAENPDAAARLAVKTIYEALVARVTIGGGLLPVDDEGWLDAILVESGDSKLMYDVGEDFVDAADLPPSIKYMVKLLCTLDSIECLIASLPNLDSQ